MRSVSLRRFLSNATFASAVAVRRSSSSPPPIAAEFEKAKHVLQVLDNIKTSNAHRPVHALIFDAAAATSLPPTALGYGGSERIIHNAARRTNPWEASCIELRERIPNTATHCANADIDFAAIRRANGRRRGEGGALPRDGPGLEVVHYFETSVPAGLAGYQYVALRVMRGELPGSCTNHSAEGGYAVWIVPLEEYTNFVQRRNEWTG